MRKKICLVVCGILLISGSKNLEASTLNNVGFISFDEIGVFFDDVTSNLFNFITGSVKDDGSALEKKNDIPKEVINDNNDNEQNVASSDFSNNKFIKTDFCDTSGHREKNVYTDIGFDYKDTTRNYLGYTNEYAQLSYVYAEELILQDDNLEPNVDGRYCSDEAKVDGVESKTLDEGHAIADSLGGVGNAYNITPQDSYLNRNGAQSQMEEYIRESLKNGNQITEFNYYVFYDDNYTQIPSSYKIDFLENGKLKEYSFDNK